MQSAKQKAATIAAAAVAKEHVEILRAKAQEKAEIVAALTKEGREIAHERRKVKEAEAWRRIPGAGRRLRLSSGRGSCVPGWTAPK